MSVCVCVFASTDVNRRCWCVTSKGMHAVGQPEVVVLLQCLPEEKRFPTDIFNHFIQIYWDAQTGKVCSQNEMTLKCILFTELLFTIKKNKIKKKRVRCCSDLQTYYSLV